MEETKRLLLDILREIHKDMQDPENWDQLGLCSRIRAACVERKLETLDGVDVRACFRTMAKDWPDYSGEEIYPVPVPVLDDDDPHPAESHFNEADGNEMWDREDSPYAESRWQLLEWTIARLEKEESNAPSA